jgi:hypothetical protein
MSERITCRKLHTSVLMASTPWCLARSMSCWSPRTQMDMPATH